VIREFDLNGGVKLHRKFENNRRFDVSELEITSTDCVCIKLIPLMYN